MINDIILIIFIKDIIINFIIHDKLLCVEARAFIVAILLECTLSVWVLEIVGGNSPRLRCSAEHHVGQNIRSLSCYLQHSTVSVSYFGYIS